MIALLRRPRALGAAGLVVLCALAWAYVLSGAGAGMSALQMTVATPFPHAVVTAPMPGMDMPMARWGATGAALTVAMWWVMMIAMMLPGAAPAILLYDGTRRRAVATAGAAGVVPTGVFVAGYLLVWLAFAVLATALQWLLVRAGWLSAEMMMTRSRALSAALLLLAGAYQLSPLKHACLSQCRSPVAFVTRHWRPGTGGALRLGALHGAWCVGCCGPLMALLFVGGVMNVIWIAALTGLVLIEKLASAGPWVGRGIGLLLIGWAIATMVAPAGG